MFKLKTIAPDEAQGQVADIYSRFPSAVGVPQAIRLMSASPDFLGRKMQDLQYWHEHATISPAMQRAMRLLISVAAGLDRCREANVAMLQLGGLTADEVAAFSGPVDTWPLGDKGNALVHFVTEHITSSQPALPARIEQLRELGWRDAEIFEGLAFGAMVHGVTTMVAVLKK